MGMNIKDLKGAKYNPRVITDRRLDALGKSYEQFGDLSGVVFNKRTRTLVTGHQRVKTLKGKKTSIKTQPHADEYGTTAIGHIIVEGASGKFTVPFRVVNWSDKKTEKAANIASNAHGGDWDKEKLAVILRELQKGEFDIEMTGLDPLTIRTLKFDAGQERGSDARGKSGSSGEFKELNADTVTTQHKCPKCGFKF